MIMCRVYDQGMREGFAGTAGCSGGTSDGLEHRHYTTAYTHTRRTQLRRGAHPGVALHTHPRRVSNDIVLMFVHLHQNGHKNENTIISIPTRPCINLLAVRIA